MKLTTPGTTDDVVTITTSVDADDDVKFFASKGEQSICFAFLSTSGRLYAYGTSSSQDRQLAEWGFKMDDGRVQGLIG